MADRYCKVCHESIDGSPLYCMSCGASLREQNGGSNGSSMKSSQDSPTRKHTKIKIAIGVIAVIALACGGAFYCAYDSGMLASTGTGWSKSSDSAKKSSDSSHKATDESTEKRKSDTTDDANDTNRKVTYDFDSESSEVEFVYHNNEKDTDLDESWTYVQFSSSQKKQDSALTQLNKTIKDNFERELQDAKEWDADSSSGPQCISHRESVTYIKDEYAVVRTERYLTTWGAHGDIEVTGTAYDLANGEDISMAKVAGQTLTDMESAAREAINKYLENNPSDIYNSSQLDDAIDKIVDDDSRYYVTKDGLLISTKPMELGSFQYGGKDIVVSSIDGSKAQKGTDFHTKYSETK